MTLPTHLAAGLIIGKLGGDYSLAFLGSTLVDFDHLLAFYRSAVLLKFKKIVAATTNKNYLVSDQRNYFHNIFFFLAVSALLILLNFRMGMIFSSAYLTHLIMDALDNQAYYPFYPNKKIITRGPIKYFSKQEIVFALALFFVFLLV